MALEGDYEYDQSEFHRARELNDRDAVSVDFQALARRLGLPETLIMRRKFETPDGLPVASND